MNNIEVFCDECSYGTMGPCYHYNYYNYFVLYPPQFHDYLPFSMIINLGCMNNSKIKPVTRHLLMGCSLSTHIECSPITIINFQSYEYKLDDLLPSLRICHPDNFLVGSTGVNTLHIQRGN